MARVEDVTEYVLRDSASGPGDQPARVAKAKPAKTLTPTLEKTLVEWQRKHDRSIGYTSKALAYGFRYIKPAQHSNMIRLIKGGHLRVCRVFASPPPNSEAHRGSPYSGYAGTHAGVGSYYIVRESCPAELPDGTLYGSGKKRRKRSRR